MISESENEDSDSINESESLLEIDATRHELYDSSESFKEQQGALSNESPRFQMHSYLPGTAHPLCLPELIDQRKRRQATQDIESGDSTTSRRRNNNPFIELPVLQLMPGIVIFPGSTIPLRLRHPDWVRYLQRQIDKVSLWNTSLLSSTSSSAFDYNRDVVAIGLLPAKFDLDSDTDIDNMIGRIGTLAVITHLSKEEEQDTTEHREIVSMALGMSRFRIVSTTADGNINSNRISNRQTTAGGRTSIREANSTRGNANIQRNHYLRQAFHGRFTRRGGGGGDMAEMTTYIVEIIENMELLKPPCQSIVPSQILARMLSTSTRNNIIYPSSNPTRYVTSYLEKISPIPALAWEKAWPWRLMQLIMEQIRSISSWQGLRSSMLSSPDKKLTTSLLPSFNKDDPSSFSFWLASNLPFSPEEQIKLLESNCILSRLRFILQYIQHENDRPLQCASCFKQVAAMKHLFTVPGAEGTTGAYVNEHGYIHQTITVKEVFEESVVCFGEPETKDSWFPGYSWTMAHCSFCLSHLGWKFLPADGNGKLGIQSRRRHDNRVASVRSSSTETADNDSEPDIVVEGHDNSGSLERQSGKKLRYFWGLSGSSIVTLRNSSSRSDVEQDGNFSNTSSESENANYELVREYVP